jgi:hypothetical protein
MLHLPRFLRAFLIISAIIGIPSIYFVYTSSESIGPDSDLLARTEVHWDAGGAAPDVPQQLKEESALEWHSDGMTEGPAAHKPSDDVVLGSVIMPKLGNATAKWVA